MLVAFGPVHPHWCRRNNYYGNAIDNVSTRVYTTTRLAHPAAVAVDRPRRATRLARATHPARRADVKPDFAPTDLSAVRTPPGRRRAEGPALAAAAGPHPGPPHASFW